GVTLKQAGSRTVTATDTFASLITGSQTVTVDPDVRTPLSETGLSELTAGTAQSVTVTALDQFENVATGYLGTVHFTGGGTGAILPANHTFVGGDAGVYTATNGVTLKQAGSRTVTATDTFASLITGSQTVTVDPDGKRPRLNSSLSLLTARAARSVTVTALDQFENVATGYLGTVHFTGGVTGAILPAHHTFLFPYTTLFRSTNGVTLKQAGSRTVTATDTFASLITGSQTVTVD